MLGFVLGSLLNELKALYSFGPYFIAAFVNAPATRVGIPYLTIPPIVLNCLTGERYTGVCSLETCLLPTPLSSKFIPEPSHIGSA